MIAFLNGWDIENVPRIRGHNDNNDYEMWRKITSKLHKFNFRRLSSVENVVSIFAIEFLRLRKVCPISPLSTEYRGEFRKSTTFQHISIKPFRLKLSDDWGKKQSEKSQSTDILPMFYSNTPPKCMDGTMYTFHHCVFYRYCCFSIRFLVFSMAMAHGPHTIQNMQVCISNVRMILYPRVCRIFLWYYCVCSLSSATDPTEFWTQWIQVFYIPNTVVVFTASRRKHISHIIYIYFFTFSLYFLYKYTFNLIHTHSIYTYANKKIKYLNKTKIVLIIRAKNKTVWKLQNTAKWMKDTTKLNRETRENL